MHPFPCTIAIAPDSYKGTLGASEAAAAIAVGFKRALPEARLRLIPMADGGEGTAAALVAARGGVWVRARAHDPLGRPIVAHYGWIAARRLAVIEMAAASGLLRVTPADRNPLVATTVGTGELMRHALDRGARRLLLCIGGSATNDGGTGMARALGARFLDRASRELSPGGGALRRLARVDLSGLDPRLRHCDVEVACDVTNPLCGPCGASAVYGPQKGATPAMVRQLDAGLAQLADVVRAQDGTDRSEAPGAGAAGGLGFGLLAFCGARLRRGVDVVSEAVGLERRLRGCDLVVTGEGRVDGQTANGKTPVGVAAVARRLGIPVVAIGGCVGEGYEAVHASGIAAVFAAAHGALDGDQLAAGASVRLARCAEEIGRLLALAPGRARTGM